MPIGTGAATLSLLPDVPYKVDPALFFSMTEQQDTTVDTYSDPGPSRSIRDDLPRDGVVSNLQIIFSGTLTVTAAASGQTQPVPGPTWPHGIIEQFVLSANGQNDLFSVDGIDLHCLRYVRWPAFQDHQSVFPGSVGGGGSALAAGTYPIWLCWDVPIAMDDATLIGSLYARSSSTNLRFRIQRNAEENLIAPGGTSSLWSLTGEFTVRETFWEVPTVNGDLIVPDIERIHLVFATEADITGTGTQYLPLIRTAGQMERLMLSGYSAPGVPMQFDASAETANQVQGLVLQYAGTKKPRSYVPATALVSQNDNWYGGPVPYNRAVFDFVRVNPTRDVVYLQGVTSLKIAYELPSSMTITNPGAGLKGVQEVLV